MDKAFQPLYIIFLPRLWIFLFFFLIFYFCFSIFHFRYLLIPFVYLWSEGTILQLCNCSFIFFPNHFFYLYFVPEIIPINNCTVRGDKIIRIFIDLRMECTLVINSIFVKFVILFNSFIGLYALVVENVKPLLFFLFF